MHYKPSECSQMPNKAKKEDEETYEEFLELVGATTAVIRTPDGEKHGFLEGTLWLYSAGMWDNYGIPDIEMRGVSNGFQKTGIRVINEMNAYRLMNMQHPMTIGDNISWSTGDFTIEEADEWEGMYSWNKDTMLRISPRIHDYNTDGSCACCQMKNTGIED